MGMEGEMMAGMEFGKLSEGIGKMGKLGEMRVMGGMGVMRLMGGKVILILGIV